MIVELTILDRNGDKKVWSYSIPTHSRTEAIDTAIEWAHLGGLTVIGFEGVEINA